MGNPARYSFLFLALAISVTGFCDDLQDRQRAEGQVRKITAMAADKTGRRMVSMSMADTFKVSRRELVERRRKLGLNYGALFVACELFAGGATISDVASSLAGGKSIWQVAEERHADWKLVGSHAKKQNSKIEDYIYRHFLNSKNEEADAQRDISDNYDLSYDAVRTDFSISTEEVIEAQTRYRFWRNQAWKSQGSGGRLSAREELAARMDHASAQHSLSGVSAPAAGGAPQP